MVEMFPNWCSLLVVAPESLGWTSHNPLHVTMPSVKSLSKCAEDLSILSIINRLFLCLSVLL